MAMLAKKYDPKYADYKGGVLVSPKLDGLRCMAVVKNGTCTLWSRGGKIIETMPHVVKTLSELPFDGEYTFDGELYYHDKAANNFQEITRAFKKYRPGVSELLKFHVYDMIDTNNTAKGRAANYLTLLSTVGEAVETVPQHLVFSEADMYQAHRAYLGHGYEGSILTNSRSQYRPKAREMLKVKEFIEEEFTIVDIIPMQNAPKQGIAVLRKGSQTFKATPKMSHLEREGLLEHKEAFIGLKGTVTYFELSEDGIPRFPILKSIGRETVEGVL